MADDIDDLLDEVEDAFLNKSKTSKRSHTTREPKNVTSKPSTMKSKITNELDDMIDDIMGDDLDVKEIKKGKCGEKHCSPKQVNKTVGNSRCMPIYLGGSSAPEGHSTAVNKCTCDQLRCTDCDFAVSTFDNYQWDQSTDYLFLRNNMPDLHRLKPKLLPRKGSRAYACQCQWRNIKDFTLLQDERQLKWFCGKH